MQVVRRAPDWASGARSISSRGCLCQLNHRMRVDERFQRVSAALRRFLWASQCVLCGGRGTPDRDLCAGCERDLPTNVRCCSLCAQPLLVAVAAAICGACVQRMPRFDACFAPYLYAYPLDHMIRALKYGGGVAHGRVLAELFVARWREAARGDRPQVLLPVPLGAARYIERGYNQAIELATHISRQLAIPVRADVLVRTRETREQAGLDRDARRKNLRKAFALRRALPAAHVAIVDDVVTTGSTANEIARMLKRAGARRVEVWAIARTQVITSRTRNEARSPRISPSRNSCC